MLRPRLSRIVPLALATVLAGFAAPVPASATATGCTAAPGNIGSLLCNNTQGSGRHVDKVRVRRWKIGENQCGYQAKVWGQIHKTNKTTTWTSKVSNKCFYGVGWIDIEIDKDFTNKSQICASWRERDAYGNWSRWFNAACNKIKLHPWD